MRRLVFITIQLSIMGSDLNWIKVIVSSFLMRLGVFYHLEGGVGHSLVAESSHPV